MSEPASSSPLIQIYSPLPTKVTLWVFVLIPCVIGLAPLISLTNDGIYFLFVALVTVGTGIVSLRIGVSVNALGIQVRNPLKVQFVPWSDVARVQAGRPRLLPIETYVVIHAVESHPVPVVATIWPRKQAGDLLKALAANAPRRSVIDVTIVGSSQRNRAWVSEEARAQAPGSSATRGGGDS